MDFRITEEQELMVQAIADAMTQEDLEPYFQECDREHKHPTKWWDLLKDLGLFSLFLPEEACGDVQSDPHLLQSPVYCSALHTQA